MMYDYDRRTAANLYGNPTLSYENRLSSLQSSFTADVGARAFEYVNMLHNRLHSKEPYSSIPGFLSWDYGSPKDLEDNSWGIRIWQKSSTQYPDDLEPNIHISLEFTRERKVVVHVEAGSKQLLSKTYAGVSSSASASSIGMAIGEAWEKTLTGSVDYGD